MLKQKPFVLGFAAATALYILLSCAHEVALRPGVLLFAEVYTPESMPKKFLGCPLPTQHPRFQVIQCMYSDSKIGCDMYAETEDGIKGIAHIEQPFEGCTKDGWGLVEVTPTSTPEDETL